MQFCLEFQIIIGPCVHFIVERKSQIKLFAHSQSICRLEHVKLLKQKRRNDMMFERYPFGYTRASQ